MKTNDRPTAIEAEVMFHVQKVGDHTFALRMNGSDLITCYVSGTWAMAHAEAVRIYKGIAFDRKFMAAR